MNVNLVKIEDGLHSNLGPSSAERWLNCPGSVLATKDLPNTESLYAAEGTAAHTVSEWCRGLNVRASQFLGKSVQVGSHVIPVDQELVDSVQTFCDYVSEFDGDAWYEARVCYDQWVPGGFGTADDIRIKDGRCVITDFKHGKGVQVFAKDNSQLKMYALGVLQDWGWAYDVQEFQINICQPRLDHIDTWVVSAADILEWADKTVGPTAKKALCGNAEFAAGSWCKFCKIKFNCAARDNWVLTQVVGEFEDLDAGLAKAAAPLPCVTDVGFLPRMLKVLAGIRAWCDDKEHYAVKMLQEGVEIGGWKLVEGRSQRAWGFPEETMVPTLHDAGLTDEQIFTKKLNGPAKIEKVLGKKNRLLATHVIKPTGKPKLAPPEDPRPALTLDKLADFKNLDEEDDD